MTNAAPLLLILTFCMIASGCQFDSDASITTDDGAHIHEAPSASSAPTVTTVTTVTGRLSGFDCAVVGQLCPTTHRGGDYTTGLYTDDGSYFFVVNIPATFLTQYFLETVEIEGRVYPPYNHAVEPEVIYLIEGDGRRMIYEEGYFIDEDKQRATFHEGQFENGQWIVP